MSSPLRQVLVNDVLTLDGHDGRAGASQSIEIAAGRIVGLDGRGGGTASTGSADGVLDLRDLDGATALPGMIDAHLHLLLGGLSLAQLDLTAVHSRDEFEAAIAEHLATLDPDQWLVGRGWSEENWPTRELPTSAWLRAAGDRPALCWRMDHHACVVNDAVLDRIRARFGTLDAPAGGRVVRDARGVPTGLLLEAAAWERAIPLVPEPSLIQRRRGLDAAMALLNRHGIVACGAMEYARDLREVVVPRRDALTVRIHATILDRDWPLDPALADDIEACDMLRVIGFKAFVDGTLGSRTAAMLAPYADDPTNSGTLVELAERGVLEPWMRAVVARGLSPSTHAIGDRALRLVLDAAEAVGVGDALRIEHAQTVHPDDLPRLRGRWASMQPQHRADDGRAARRRLGPERMERFFPFRRLIEHGAMLAFGSDWPIVAPDPMAGVRAAVTAEDLDGRVVEPDQALTPLEALRAYTRGAAACLRMTDGGRLEVGQRADITVLDRDPLACDWRAETPRVLATVVAGRLVWSSSIAGRG